MNRLSEVFQRTLWPCMNKRMHSAAFVGTATALSADRPQLVTHLVLHQAGLPANLGSNVVVRQTWGCQQQRRCGKVRARKWSGRRRGADGVSAKKRPPPCTRRALELRWPSPAAEKSGIFWPRAMEFITSIVEMPVWIISSG